MIRVNDAVSTVRPVAPYIGGKRNLSRRICSIVDSDRHHTYAEPFIGMGGVFLRRTRRAPAEVINDISADVTTMFRVVRKHYPALVDELAYMLSSRDEFERQRAIDPATLTDIERAARFLCLQRLSFGGKVSGRVFGVDCRSPGRLRLATLRDDLQALRDRLAAVTIERLPFAELIDRYDSADTLFYLDPPYWACETDYGGGVFERDDFARLADQLMRIKGRFILSLNDTPGVRDVFRNFAFEEVVTTYTLATAATGSGKRVGELIIVSKQEILEVEGQLPFQSGFRL